MVVSVIGCGESGRHWQATQCDLSIGVNDVLKFGASPDWLLCINGMNKFTDARKKLIMDTRPKKFFSHNSGWLNHFSLFCETERLGMHSWRGYVKRGRNYSSLTSPFVAICLAFNAGATDIIVWGVDFNNHPAFPEGSYALKRELKNYNELISSIESQGTKVWAGCEGSILNIPIWQNHQQ